MPIVSYLLKERLCLSDFRVSFFLRNKLPDEIGAVGIWSPWGFLWFSCFMVAPIAYIYILLMLLRDLCWYFPETVYQTLDIYVPWLARLADLMKNSSRVMDVWCVIEGVFFVICKLKIRYLQGKDPLEASLSAAPMMDPEDRKFLWDRIMDTEKEDPMKFITGWFFDQKIEDISRYDVFDFICWSLFDSRNQEHLTTEELHDLECFLEDLEYRISLQIHGPMMEENEQSFLSSTSIDEGGNENDNPNEAADDRLHSPTKDYRKSERDDDTISSNFTGSLSRHRPRPRHSTSPVVRLSRVYDDLESWIHTFTNMTSYFFLVGFRFSVDNHREEPTFFSNLYEAYKERYDQYRNMIESADFHPVQDLRNIIAEKAQQAEETAKESAQQMYETFVQPGSSLDKHLSALSSATSVQLSEAWHSVRQMRERVETATFLAARRTTLMEQLRGNRAMLTRMREMSYAVPSKQMAAVLRRITECYDALESIEQRASIQFEKFVNATGALADRGSSLLPQKEPRRYAKYSSDPLLGIVTYPLGFHLLVLGASEIPLRMMLKNRGFERRFVGPVAYYHHPGSPTNDAEKPRGKQQLPIVFIHGIGIGIIAYIQLIDYFLLTGRPILLPEIPYVSGFRPWQGPNSVLSPAVVASTVRSNVMMMSFVATFRETSITPAVFVSR